MKPPLPVPSAAAENFAPASTLVVSVALTTTFPPSDAPLAGCRHVRTVGETDARAGNTDLAGCAAGRGDRLNGTLHLHIARRQRHRRRGRSGFLRRRGDLRRRPDLEVVAGGDRDAAARATGTTGIHHAADVDVADGDDLNGTVAGDERAAFHHAFGIDGRLEERAALRVTLRFLDGARDPHVLRGDGDAARGVDRAFHDDSAIRRNRRLAGNDLVGQRAVDAAARVDHLIEDLRTRRDDRQLADVDRALRADDESIGIGEDNVAADRTVLVGIQRALDVDRGVADDVDEYAGVRRHVEIGRIALCESKARERVVGFTADDRARADIRRASGDTQRRRCASIGNNIVSVELTEIDGLRERGRRESKTQPPPGSAQTYAAGASEDAQRCARP